MRGRAPAAVSERGVASTSPTAVAGGGDPAGPGAAEPSRPGGSRVRAWSVRILALVGIVAMAQVVLSAFTSLEEPPGVTWRFAAPEVRTQDMLLALSGAVHAPVRRGGSAQLLVNGDAYLPALLEEIGRAEASIHFMTYVWRPGEMSDRLFDALTARAREGVAVRLLLDAHGGADAPADRIAALREAGGWVAFYRPLMEAGPLDFNVRNHRRAMVFDGRVAFTGGAGVADTWLGDAQASDHWRDDLTRVTGPLARSLQAAFAQVWSETTGELLAGPAVYPPEPEGDPAPAATPVTFHIGVLSSPGGADRPLTKAWWASFAGARERIWITTPYFVPDDPVLELLAERARAGVDVRVLTAGEQVDFGFVRHAGRHLYGPLLEAGGRIYEYQPARLHSKLVVVDGIWSLVGSPNLDVRSEEINQENLLAILDVGFAAELEATFRDDLARSREISLEAWRDRPFFERLLGRVGALLREQL